MSRFLGSTGISSVRTRPATPTYVRWNTTRAPLLGATAAATFPGNGTWTSIYDSPGQSIDDTFFGPIRLPFLFPYNGVFYHEVYISSNGYLTFGGGSSQYLSLTLSSPSLNKIYLYPADMRLHRCYIKQAAEDNIFYIRLESTTFNGGTAYGNSTTVVEVAFYSPATGAPLIEIISGVNNVVDSNLTGLVGSTNFLPGGQMPNGLTANRSCVYVGDATGSNWTFYDNTQAFVGLNYSAGQFSNFGIHRDSSGYDRILTKRSLGDGIQLTDFGSGVKGVLIAQSLTSNGSYGPMPPSYYSNLEIPGYGQLTFGTQDFSIEFFSRFVGFYFNSTGGSLISCGQSNVRGTNTAWRITISANRAIGFVVHSGSLDYPTSTRSDVFSLTTGDSVAATNVWKHYAVTRVGTTITLYVNGTAVASSTVASDFNIGNVPDEIALAGNVENNQWLSSYYTGLRVCIGSSAYSGNFTPALPTVIANTRLLMNWEATAAPTVA